MLHLEGTYLQTVKRCLLKYVNTRTNRKISLSSVNNLTSCRKFNQFKQQGDDLSTKKTKINDSCCYAVTNQFIFQKHKLSCLM